MLLNNSIFEYFVYFYAFLCNAFSRLFVCVRTKPFSLFVDDSTPPDSLPGFYLIKSFSFPFLSFYLYVMLSLLP